jgi:hypothetical protein
MPHLNVNTEIQTAVKEYKLWGLCKFFGENLREIIVT